MNTIKVFKSGSKHGLTLDNYALKLCAYITYSLTLSSFWVIDAKDIHSDDLPYFADTLNNVTVAVGRDATFQCIVHNLKKEYQVAWFHKDKHTLLALHDTVIFRSGRLSVSSHAATTFYLHIHDIREEDRGYYMCQINTVPMISQIAFLEVVVPPRFLEKYTSSDLEVREGSPVSLRCSATGFPEPDIKWRREDSQPIDLKPNISSNSQTKATSMNGEYLNITKVTRLHMVLPLIWPPNQMVGTSIGSDVTLKCNLESHPHSLTSWIRNSNRGIIHPNDKYSIYTEPTSSPYKIGMRLKIKEITSEDFGTYSCLAKNSEGEGEANIKLLESSKPTNPLPAKETKSRKKIYYKPNNIEDNEEEEQNLRAVVLTEMLGYEITSEHITLQTEDRVTHNSGNHNSEKSNPSYKISPNIAFICFISFLYLSIQRLRF